MDDTTLDDTGIGESGDIKGSLTSPSNIVGSCYHTHTTLAPVRCGPKTDIPISAFLSATHTRPGLDLDKCINTNNPEQKHGRA